MGRSVRHICYFRYMPTSQDTASPHGELRETMTMGEAASLLGVDRATVRRMCKAYEKNPDVGLPFAWTSPLSDRTDRNGHRLRGHRRPFAASVRKMARETGRLAEES